MKKQLKIILLLTGFFALSTACKKDPPVSFCNANPDECVDVRVVKDYFYFEPGSYWVYQEENSGDFDSIYPLAEHCFSDSNLYYFTTRVYSTHNDCEYRFWTPSATPDVLDGKNLVKKSERSTSVKRAKFNDDEGFVAESKCFLFYPYAGHWGYTNGGGAVGYNNVLKVDSTFSSYTLRDLTYSDVVLITEDYTVIENSQPTRHYYAKGVGLIRKELLDSNQVWNLVRYHIQD